MIEFRSDKGMWACGSCFAEVPVGSFRANGKAIVEDGVWYFEASCADERHIAEALEAHAHRKAHDADSMDWHQVERRCEGDYLSTLEGS